MEVGVHCEERHLACRALTSSINQTSFKTGHSKAHLEVGVYSEESHLACRALSSSINQTSFKTGHSNGRLGSGCPLRGEASRMSGLIQLYKSNFLQNWAFKRPTWKWVSTARRGISHVGPYPALSIKLPAKLGIQTAHLEVGVHCEERHLACRALSSSINQTSFKTGHSNGPLGSGCPLRGEASRMSGLIQLYKSNFLQN